MFYCGQESLFFPLQRLHSRDFPSLKNGGLVIVCFFFLPAEVTWVENTNKTVPCVPSLQPQAATFPHPPLGSCRVSCFCPEGPSSSLCSHPHLKISAQATSSRKHSKWPWAPSLTSSSSCASLQHSHYHTQYRMLAQPPPDSVRLGSGTGGVSYSSSETPIVQ